MSVQHERVVVERGGRSGRTLIVALHSTALGPAAGGCRLREYPDWRDGLDDALRLSEAMTLKCAAAELPLGGGKSVIALEPGDVLTPEQRRDVFLDFGDLVESFGGRYKTGEDVGTSADDMWIARERTEHALCVPPEHGGSGEPSEPTAVGVLSAIEEVSRRLFGTDDLTGRRFTVIGLGQVGGRLARRLAARGAVLSVTDVVPGKQELARELGASWVTLDEAPRLPTDVLVPAALGDLLTPELVARLDCRAVVGPANNQLASPSVADDLAARGILWAPDFVVNAGGAIHGALVDIAGHPVAYGLEQAALIGPRLGRVLDHADRTGVTPYAAAVALARQRVQRAEAERLVLVGA